MAQYTFVMASGTLADADVEREHVGDRSVDFRLASLTTPEEVVRETADADGVLVTLNPLPRSLIDCLGPKVRVIGRAGVGLDSIDLEAARDRGIAVYHTPDYATNEVATHAVDMILATNRRLLQGDTIARTSWKSWRELAPVIALHEQTVGVVGAGSIGRAVIQRMRHLAGDVLFFDPYVQGDIDGANRADSLDSLLESSDVITLHVPATSETAALIGEREIAQMKPGAVVVNVSRGKLIDEEALASALHSGRLGAAALDVLVEEPPPADASILHAPNVLLSPHFAWHSVTAEHRMRTMAVDGMLDYLEGRPQRAGRLAIEP